MATEQLIKGDVLVNRYSQLEVKVLAYNPEKNWYDALRLTDKREIAVGNNWWTFYDRKSPE
jgi:hypothetical protein